MRSETSEASSGSDEVGAEPDEPPSPGPSGPTVASPLTVLTADQRSSGTDAPPVTVDLDALASLLGRVLTAEGVAEGAEASLTLVDPDEIAALKAEHLDGDGAPTDVLSFPIDGAEGPTGSSPGDGPGWMVGDVVVCPAVAAEQAPAHAGTVEDELALLVVHAGLHLVGWDHDTDPRRAAMWARERDLLSELHREPAHDPWSAHRR
jgi:probable rRNA maturation factor